MQAFYCTPCAIKLNETPLPDGSSLCDWPSLEEVIDDPRQIPVTFDFVKLRPDAVTPSKAHPDDAGFDLVAVEITQIPGVADVLVFRTHIAIGIPRGWEGQLRPRSSNRKNSLILCNAPGTIDAGYHGSIDFSYKVVGEGATPQVGDKIGQIVFHRLPKVLLNEVVRLPDSERGTKGHGSSGN